MKTLVLCATLACLTTAPLAALALGDADGPPATLFAEPVPVEASATHAAVANARLVFLVRHTGSSAPAILTVEGPSTSVTRAVVLDPGVNSLVDGHFPVGKYRIGLQNAMTAGSNTVDLASCPIGVVASMNTTFSMTRFALSIPADTCVAAQG